MTSTRSAPSIALWERYRRGAAAGLAADLAHTVVMLALRRVLAGARGQRVPPRQITARIAERLRLRRVVSREPERSVATTALHVGYGVAAGALYGPLGARARRWPIAAGLAYGLGVWAISYLGWIPALRILPAATREPAGRNAMMIAAHAAWGLALGLAFDTLERRDRRFLRRS